MTTIEKNGVLYVFPNVPEEPHVNDFIKRVFKDWEYATFQVFEKVKNNDKIAIDIGGWIGTTCIWLSKNFKNVICVEPDKKSLAILKQAVSLSNCTNVTISEKAIFNELKTLSFGGFGDLLNTSMSHIKLNDDIACSSDHIVNTITLDSLIKENNISYNDVGFIKCDIEGGEEYILDIITDVSLKYRIPLYISFHYDWWKNKNIETYSEQFEKMKNNGPVFWINNVNQIIEITNIIDCIKNDPFCSVFFSITPNQAAVISTSPPKNITNPKFLWSKKFK